MLLLSCRCIHGVLLMHPHDGIHCRPQPSVRLSLLSTVDSDIRTGPVDGNRRPESLFKQTGPVRNKTVNVRGPQRTFVAHRSWTQLLAVRTVQQQAVIERVVVQRVMGRRDAAAAAAASGVLF